ncbi:hypothetical protein E6C76_08770 [Pseudothauera nasutitermitis]|uniref:Uncharacterized protein n=1 Tax=Pseudothauera nasutitermitis TaxID=2565930 RepID=A0A4S4AZN7_9RHOO|nr:hypothetical protein [Pseudothauera nasutitermitis]THF65648.1 hypothetical protein E6C76_08770 [Pseudothauera nasutitermitis]
MLTTLATVSRGDGVTILAESALPPNNGAQYVSRPLLPNAARRVGLAVADEHQSSPATRVSIKLALKMVGPGLA